MHTWKSPLGTLTVHYSPDAKVYGDLVLVNDQNHTIEVNGDVLRAFFRQREAEIMADKVQCLLENGEAQAVEARDGTITIVPR